MYVQDALYDRVYHSGRNIKTFLCCDINIKRPLYSRSKKVVTFLGLNIHD